MDDSVPIAAVVKLAGNLDAAQIPSAFASLPEGGRFTDVNRYFHDEGELLHHDGSTWLLTKMWGSETQQCLQAMCEAFPQCDIKIEIAE